MISEWDYCRDRVPDLTRMGAEGWELVAVHDGAFIFKRPAESATERFTREQTERALLGSAPHGIPPRVLNPELAALIRRIGHTQMLLICDSGFPVPFDLPGGTLDLSVTADVPTVVQVLEAILPELPHDRIIVASEMAQRSPDRFAWHTRQTARVETHPHASFKALARQATACIRTGDTTAYANAIVVGG